MTAGHLDRGSEAGVSRNHRVGVMKLGPRQPPLVRGGAAVWKRKRQPFWGMGSLEKDSELNDGSDQGWDRGDSLALRNQKAIGRARERRQRQGLVQS